MKQRSVNNRKQSYRVIFKIKLVVTKYNRIKAFFNNLHGYTKQHINREERKLQHNTVTTSTKFW